MYNFEAGRKSANAPSHQFNASHSTTNVARLCWHQKKVPSASLVKMTLWTFVEAQITNIEMKHDALLKIVVEMHSQFGPIWQIFLPLYHQPSKRASCFISILGNLASTKVHKLIFISEMLGTFFWCHHRLAIAVQHLLKAE